MNHLDLSVNNLKIISDNAFEYISHLEYLNLSQNHITAIDELAFGRLRHMKVLDLSFNQLESDNFLWLFEALPYLNLSYNNFREINVTLLNMLCKNVELYENPWDCPFLVKEISMHSKNAILHFGKDYVVKDKEEILSVPGIHCVELNGREKNIILLNPKENEDFDTTKVFTKHKNKSIFD